MHLMCIALQCDGNYLHHSKVNICSILAPYSLHMLESSEYEVCMKQILLWCKYNHNTCVTTV